MALNKKIEISKIEISDNFDKTSDYFGYDDDTRDSYDEDVLKWRTHWESKGYIEVSMNCSSYPLLKDSNSTEGSSPSYIGLYHAQVDPDYYNPLIVITFRNYIIKNEKYEKAVIETLISHADMFGDRTQKKDNTILKALKNRNRKVIDDNTSNL